MPTCWTRGAAATRRPAARWSSDTSAQVSPLLLANKVGRDVDDLVSANLPRRGRRTRSGHPGLSALPVRRGPESPDAPLPGSRSPQGREHRRPPRDDDERRGVAGPEARTTTPPQSAPATTLTPYRFAVELAYWGRPDRPRSRPNPRNAPRHPQEPPPQGPHPPRRRHASPGHLTRGAHSRQPPTSTNGSRRSAAYSAHRAYDRSTRCHHAGYSAVASSSSRMRTIASAWSSPSGLAGPARRLWRRDVFADVAFLAVGLQHPQLHVGEQLDLMLSPVAERQAKLGLRWDPPVNSKATRYSDVGAASVSGTDCS